jgi:hypothetical protein
MRTVIDCKPGEFYELAGLYFLPLQDLAAGTALVLGPRLPLSCMFEIHFAMIGSERVGYFLQSRFEVVNGGGYLQTYLKGKGPAKETEVLIKDETLVVYNFPNRGALAITPLVNSEIETILTEQ